MAELHPFAMYEGDVPSANTALVVVDMQRVFFDENDSLGRAGLDVKPLRAAIPGCVRLIELARKAKMPVIFTRFVYMPGMVDFGQKYGAAADARESSNSLGYGTPETEIIPEMGVQPNDIIIEKSRPSAFYATRLEPVLNGLGIRNLIVCGVTTNMCVEGTVRDAGQRDYGTFVVRDAVAEFLSERNHYALFSMAWLFAHVIDVADVERSVAERPRAKAV
jgi:ureidoacrylate peracid hydrolase